MSEVNNRMPQSTQVEAGDDNATVTKSVDSITKALRPDSADDNVGNVLPLPVTVTGAEDLDDHLTDDQIKSAYFKLREVGVKPSARRLRELLGRGSYTRLQKEVKHLDEILTNKQLDDLTKKRVPDSVISTLAEELAQMSCKWTIDDYEAKITSLTNLLVDAEASHHKEMAEAASKLDESAKRESELRERISILSDSNEELKKREVEHLNQIGTLTYEVNSMRERYASLSGLANLIKLLSARPEMVDDLSRLLGDDAGKIAGADAKTKEDDGNK